jgi:hypothetical protein
VRKHSINDTKLGNEPKMHRAFLMVVKKQWAKKPPSFSAPDFKAAISASSISSQYSGHLTFKQSKLTCNLVEK